MPVLKDLLDAYNTVEKCGHPQIVFPTIWHELKAADVEIMIGTDGHLVIIRRLERWVTKENENGKKIKVRGACDAVTPVTLYSECRTGSKPAPRPLSDGCKYFAGDLAGTERKFFDAEMELLHSWNEFAGGNRKLEAIIAYLSKETLAGDIVSSGILDEVAEKDREEALQRLAATLRQNFRADDYVCRIGGDEFVVLMVHVTPDVKRLIERKVKQINEDLRESADGLPPMSVSVGVSMCRDTDNPQDMFHEADVALYHVKDHGRCGCCFYEPGMREKDKQKAG